MKSFAFWTVGALLVIPAIVGASIAIGVILAAVVVCLVAVTLMALTCIPIIWWCAAWEGVARQSILSKLRLSKPVSN